MDQLMEYGLCGRIQMNYHWIEDRVMNHELLIQLVMKYELLIQQVRADLLQVIQMMLMQQMVNL